ncbi:hypothetical protein ACWCQQ_46995 [Streptomyces sp. NPDC002143]
MQRTPPLAVRAPRSALPVRCAHHGPVVRTTPRTTRTAHRT